MAAKFEAGPRVLGTGPVTAADTDHAAPPFLVAHVRGRYRVVLIDEIRWVEADGNYMIIHSDEGEFPVRVTCRQLESRLAPYGFLRARRGVLVSMREVKEVQIGDGNTQLARLRRGEVIRVSLEFRRRLQADAIVPTEAG